MCISLIFVILLLSTFMTDNQNIDFVTIMERQVIKLNY